MPPRKRARSSSIAYTVPGMATDDAEKVIAAHSGLDPQVDGMREVVDDLAERIGTLGGSPSGTPGARRGRS